MTHTSCLGPTDRVLISYMGQTARNIEDDRLCYRLHIDTRPLLVRVEIQPVTTKDHFGVNLRLETVDCGHSTNGGTLNGY